MYFIPWCKYLILLVGLLLSIIFFIYLLNSSVDSMFSIVKQSLNLNQNNIKYITYNDNYELKNQIQNYFIKFLILLAEKKYDDMLNIHWISPKLISNIQKYNLSIFPIKEVKKIEIMSFIQDCLKVKIFSESLNFENKFFANILDIKINIFNKNIIFENIYVKQYPDNFFYANLYLDNNWKELVENKGK